MSNTAVVVPLVAARAPMLGPARVHAVEAHGTWVDLESGRRVLATIALADRYQPEPADVLLVIGDGDRFYVIGVIDGRGRHVIERQGDVELRAVGGRVRLHGDRGVDVDAPEVTVRARAAHVVVDKITAFAQNVRQRIGELLHLDTGERHEIVRGTALTQAKRATLLTEEKVSINGKEIHLG
jgi:hypothetical protein